MTTIRSNHTDTLLNNGKVLVAGGLSGASLSLADLYPPRTYDIYAQKYNSSGTLQWAAADVKVNSDSGNRTPQTGNPSNYDHLNPRVKLDASNNTIIVWQEAR